MKNTAYTNIIGQLKAAQNQNLVSFYEIEQEYTTVKFCDHIKKTTIYFFIKILESKYHTELLIKLKDDLTIEIWNKRVDVLGGIV